MGWVVQEDPVCCVKIPFYSVLLGNFLNSHLKMDRRFSEMTHRWCAFLGLADFFPEEVWKHSCYADIYFSLALI